MNSEPTTITKPDTTTASRRRGLRRRIAVVAMLGSALTLGGAGILATAGSAGAVNWAGDPTCTLTGTVDLSQQVPALTGTLGSCKSFGEGAITAVFNLTGAPAPGSITWVGHNVTSSITLSVVTNWSTGLCPATAGGDYLAAIAITFGGGPTVGTSGGGSMCVDFSHYPVLSVTNSGPINL
jgi:hypothetical protein